MTLAYASDALRSLAWPVFASMVAGETPALHAQMAFFVTAVFSYLLGSIPFGYIFVWTFRGQDVRETGSGNIGATNVARSSPALGLLTLLFDALKGLGCVLLTRHLFPGQDLLAAVAALFAILGHMFPVWLKFRGGKGVATGLGSFAAIAPKAVLVMLGVFIAVVLASRYVSLASIVAVALFPLIAWLLGSDLDKPLMIGVMATASLLIVAKHHGNIRRLLAGTESRFSLRRG